MIHQHHNLHEGYTSRARATGVQRCQISRSTRIEVSADRCGGISHRADDIFVVLLSNERTVHRILRSIILLFVRTGIQIFFDTSVRIAATAIGSVLSDGRRGRGALEHLHLLHASGRAFGFDQTVSECQ